MLLLVLVGVLVFIMKQNPEHTGGKAQQSPVANFHKGPLLRHDGRSRSTNPVSESAEADSNTDSQANTRHLQFFVQDENGQAIAGAEVRTKIDAAAKSGAATDFNKTFITTSQGFADVLWPGENLAQLELTASKQGYASRKMVWDLKTGDTVPATFTLKLKKGMHFGGIVVDPEGNPVSGATVSVYRFWSGGEMIKTKGEDPALSREKQTTGEDGRWSMDNLPSELVDHMMAEATHTNFIAAHITIDDKNVAEMQKDTHKLVLTRGLEIRGRVLDDQDNPLKGASVWAGRKFHSDRQETKTDAEGRFSFRNLTEGKVLFSVMADGFEPDNKSHEVSSQTPEIVFRLKKGTGIGAVVQNTEGEPIEGVRVSLEGYPGEPAGDAYEFSTSTDQDGRFKWLSAPNEPMPFYFGKEGYEQKRGVRLQPGNDNVVTLRRSRQVQGQVIDADTGNPVTSFHVTLGKEWQKNEFSPDVQSAKDFTSAEGSFTMLINEESQTHIQASATNYTEQSLALPESEGDQVQVIFKLKQSAPLQGIVLTSDGTPVPGATVTVISGDTHSIMLGANGKLRDYNPNSKLVTTDDSGKFQIPSPPDQETVIASKDEGFASAPIAEVKASGKLTLDLYGRIEGTIIRGTAPGEGQELLLGGSSGMSFDFAAYKVTADANGQFVFEKVPAGKVWIIRLVKTSTRSWAHSHSTEVTVEAGKTTQVTLGGVDATLSGHVTFQTDLPQADYTLSGQLSTPLPKLPDGLTSEQTQAYINSPEWKEQLKNVKRYTVAIASDGTMMLDSVASGDYDLIVTATPSDAPFSGAPLAEAKVKVSVPAGSSPSSPINIGEIALRPPARSK